MEFILYAHKIGNPEYFEDIITVTESRGHLAKAKSWAEQNGFDHFRIAHYTPGTIPDFTKTINI